MKTKKRKAIKKGTPAPRKKNGINVRGFELSNRKEDVEAAIEEIDRIRILFGKTYIFNQKFIDFFSAYDNALVQEFFKYQVKLAKRVLRADAQRRKILKSKKKALLGKRISFREFYTNFLSSGANTVNLEAWDMIHMKELNTKNVKRYFKKR